MVALRDVKRWNAAALEVVFQTVRQRQGILTSAGDDFLTALPVDGWYGSAADNAVSAHRSLVSALDHLAAGVSIVNKTIAQAADAIPAVQRDISNAEALAARYGFQIGDDGVINDVLPDPGPSDPSPADRSRVRLELGGAIEQALRTAADIDNDLADVLRRAGSGGFGTGTETTIQGAAADALQESQGETLTTPPPNGTPSRNAGWWNSLSQAGQAILLRDHPDWLGNLDGLPGTVCSQANLARLPVEYANLQRKLEDLRRRLPGYINPDDPIIPIGPEYAADREMVAEFKDAEAKLAALEAIRATMAKGNRQLLTLDTSGRRVQAAVAVGNVDTAEHVAVFTPGFTSTVQGSLKGYDQGMRDLQFKGQDLSRRYGDRSQVAAVTWIGYDAPQLSEIADPGHSVALDADAKAGAAKLDGFLDGIGASHNAANQPLHLTALGHSYGSLTTGIALQQPTPVHDAVVFGSPGMDINNVHDLKVPDGHTFSEMADQDYVPDLDIAHHFGTSPYAIPDIHRMSTDAATGVDGQPLAATHDHSGYLTDNSTSQYNMAAIVAGRPDLAIDYQPQAAPPETVPTPPAAPQPPPTPR
jgi:hypothetical protein